MNNSDKFRLWQFSELSKLGDKTTLVKNNNDGRLMILSEASEESYPLFRVMCGIGHPNLMKVYDTIVEDGKCLSLCEYVPGETVGQAVESGRIYSEADAISITAQLCDALGELHKHGIVHRDITPSNVMLDQKGFVRLIDYDIIRTVKPGMNRDTQILGTPSFAAPEQFGFSQTDARADIYSCGVLINYMLTGEVPGKRLCSGRLNPIVLRCIEMDAQNRFQSPEELKRALLGHYVAPKPDQPKKYINYSRLPGFRTDRVFPKILTVLIMSAYFVTLFAYFHFMLSTSLSYPFRFFLMGIMLFLLLTAIPYVCIGDAFRLSARLFRKNPRRGKTILKIIGIASLIAGFLLMTVISSVWF